MRRGRVTMRQTHFYTEDTDHHEIVFYVFHHHIGSHTHDIDIFPFFPKMSIRKT